MCTRRDALSSGVRRKLAPSAVLLGLAVLLTCVCFAAIPAGSDSLSSDDAAPEVAESGPMVPMVPSLLVPILGIPLRVRRENVLDNSTRKTLYRLVQAHPGIHLRGLVQSSGLGFGAVSYHLRVLQVYDLISAIPSGIRLCFYPVDVEPLRCIPMIPRRRIQVLEAVERFPGLGLGEIGELLGLSPKTVAYHLRVLRWTGLVDSGRPLRPRRSALGSCESAVS